MHKPKYPDWIKVDYISLKKDYDLERHELLRIWETPGQVKSYITWRQRRRRKEHKSYLNLIYQKLRPGALICSCGGHTSVKSLRISVDIDTGYITEVNVIGHQANSSPWGCSWGNCVSLREANGFCPQCGGDQTWGNNPGQEEEKAAFDAEWGKKE